MKKFLTGISIIVGLLLTTGLTLAQGNFADIWIDMIQISNNPTGQGDTVDYKVTFGNNTIGTSENVSVTINIPAELKLTDHDTELTWIPPNYTIQSGLEVIATDNQLIFSGIVLYGEQGSQYLEPFEPYYINFSTEVIDTLMDGDTLELSAIIAGTNDNTPDNNKTGFLSTIDGIADLAIGINHINSLPFDDGDPIVFEITYQNIGNKIATGIEISPANIPSELGGIGIEPIISIDSLLPNQTGNYILTGYLSGSYMGGHNFWFPVEITSESEESNLKNNNDEVKIIVFAQADLFAISEPSGNSPRLSGDQIEYVITYGNKGNQGATNVILNAILPPEISNITTYPVYTNIETFDTGTLLSWEIDSLPIDTNYDIKIDGNINTDLDFETQICIQGNIFMEGEDTLENNVFEKSCHVVGGIADVSISGKVISNIYHINKSDTIVYQIDIANIGHDIATGVMIQLDFDDQVDLDKFMLVVGDSAYRANVQNNTIIWGNFNMPINQTGKAIITGTLNTVPTTPITLSTQGEITTQSLETILENNTFTHEIDIQPFTNIDIEASIANQTHPELETQAIGEDVMKIDIAYSNLGTTIAQDGTITITPSENLKLLSFNGQPIAGTNTFIVTELPGGSVRNLTMETQLMQQNFGSETITLEMTYTINGEEQTRTETFTITELGAICGDGYISSGEPCDTNSDENIWPGQSCVNNNGVCEIQIDEIVNTACVYYQGQEDCYSVNVDIVQRPIAQCEELYALHGNVVIADFPDLDEVEIPVSCSTSGGVLGNITIDCGPEYKDNRYFDGFTDELFAVCKYDADEDDTYPYMQDITCTVGDETVPNPNCETQVMVDNGFWGICGDGQLDSWEECDLGDDEQYIEDYLDEDENYHAPNRYRNEGYMCDNCNIKDPDDPDDPYVYSPPACFNASSVLSVQEDEILPFRWRVEVDGDSVSYEDDAGERYCDEEGVIKDSMKCHFQVYRGDDDEMKEVFDHNIKIKCFSDGRDENDNNEYDDEIKYLAESNIYDIFQSITDNPERYVKAMGRYYLPINEEFLDLDNKYGEYKLVLEEVEYEFCDEEGRVQEGTPVQRVCETNFVTTKPYLVQKSSFGFTPTSTNINLDNFYDIHGDSLVNRTDLNDIMILKEENYNGGGEIDILMHQFIQKYDQLAIEITDPSIKSRLNAGPAITLKKVPGKQIYIFEGAGADTLTLNELNNGFDKPFTMIVKNMNLLVKGDITNTNGMFLVQGGEISFLEPDLACRDNQKVNGIFITNLGFGVDQDGITINNDFGRPRCNYGGLEIEGVLIGGGIEDLVQQRRSHLNEWFNVSSTTAAGIKTQRRKQIFDGAAVSIEYSPTFWQALPPGAEEFTQVLDVYKR